MEVESIDRVGNMLGWLFLSDGTNLAEKLVRSGLATVHGSAERSRYATALYKAEEEAKAARRNVCICVLLLLFVVVSCGQIMWNQQLMKQQRQCKVVVRLVIVCQCINVLL